MMKKLMMLMVSGVTVLVLSGCGGGGGDVIVDDGSTALFLVDQDNFAYANVPYQCDGRPTEYTLSNGKFIFYPGEICTFDFDYLAGNYNYDLNDDIIYIVDDLDGGKSGIPYDCDLFGMGTTDYDGSFYYDANDICSFSL